MGNFSKAKNTVKIHTEQNTNFTSLSPKVVTKLTQALPMQQSFRMLRAELIIALVGWSNSEETGPIMVGMAPNHYSATEIEEWLEENGPAEPNDDTPMERSKRRIWHITQFFPKRSAAAEQMQQVKTKVLKPQWTFTVGSETGGWNFWYYNWSGSSMNAEVKVLSIMADYYGVWVI